MSGKRRSLTEAIRAMVKHPTADREGTSDLVEVLRFTVDLHVPTTANADRFGRYGRCRGCGQWWPCQPWNAASYAAVEWLVNASNAVMRRSGSLSPALGIGGRPPKPDVELPACLVCGEQCTGGR